MKGRKEIVGYDTGCCRITQFKPLAEGKRFNDLDHQQFSVGGGDSAVNRNGNLDFKSKSKWI